MVQCKTSQNRADCLYPTLKSGEFPAVCTHSEYIQTNLIQNKQCFSSTFFPIFYYCYCCDFITVLNLLIRLVQDLKHGCAFGWEACFLLRGVLSALAASCCYNQNLNLYTCNMLDFVTELCFATILMKIYIYIFLSCLGSHWYAKSWLYWHVG